MTVRAGPQVRRERFDALEAALDALERHGHESARAAPREAVKAKIRRFEPVQIVTARLELAGPQRLVPDIRGGLDVRADGSIEAFTGRMHRRVIEQRKGEDAYAALRRTLTARGSRR